MKDHDWAWTLLGAALVSLESLDMIFDVQNAKIWPIQPIFSCGPFAPPLFKDSETPTWLGLKDYPYFFLQVCRKHQQIGRINNKLTNWILHCSIFASYVSQQIVFLHKLLLSIHIHVYVFVKLQAKSLDQEMTLFYPCQKNKKNNKNPSPKSIKMGCTRRLKFDIQTSHRLSLGGQGPGRPISQEQQKEPHQNLQ